MTWTARHLVNQLIYVVERLLDAGHTAAWSSGSSLCQELFLTQRKQSLPHFETTLPSFQHTAFSFGLGIDNAQQDQARDWSASVIVSRCGTKIEVRLFTLGIHMKRAALCSQAGCAVHLRQGDTDKAVNLQPNKRNIAGALT